MKLVIDRKHRFEADSNFPDIQNKQIHFGIDKDQLLAKSEKFDDSDKFEMIAILRLDFHEE